VSDVTRTTPSASEPVLSPTVDSAALVTEVGGVPVVNQAATEIPNVQEGTACLKPPIPEEPDEREDERTTPPDVLLEEPVAKEPTPTPIQPPLSRDQEIPNSQESNLNVIPPSPSEDASLPDSPSQINQLSPHTPLAVTTDQGNRARQVTPLKKLAHPDASSPASSDNASTPENVISSATSPDSNQLPEPTGPNAVKDGGESMEKAFVSTAEHTTPKSVEKPEETLTSTEVAEEVVETEQELRAPLLTSKDASTRVGEEAKERELPASSVAEAPATAPQSPVSPDPSSVQLRLESQLANGEVPSVLPVPEDLPALSETKVATTPSPSPSPRQSVTPASEPSSPPKAVEDSMMDEDDEDEDHVQLVGSTEPVTRVPSPTVPTPETKPQAVPEAPVVTEKQTSTVPSKPLTCEPEAPKGRDVTSSDAVDGEAPKLLAISQSEAAQPDIMEVDARAQSPLSPEVPESLVMPMDVGKPEMDQEDTVMQDAVLEPDGTTTVPAEKPEGQSLVTKRVQNDWINKLRQQKQPTQEAPLPGDLSLSATSKVDLDEVEVDGIAVPAEVPEERSRATSATPDHSQPPRNVSESAVEASLPSTIESGAWESAVPTQTQFTPPTQGEDASFTVPALFSPARRSSSRQRRPSQRAQLSTLSKVVISSAHHAAAAAEAEAQRLREDQEQQGLIVVARRRNQQAAAVAGRGRSSVFPPGSKLDLLTKYTIQDDATKEHKTPDPFDVLYTAKSVPTSVGELLLKASKTITTDNHNLAQDDILAVKVLTRIQDLQDQDMWSLQQVAKVAEPKRRVTHWDYLLKEMKWLTTDFKEERKWKISQAKCLVDMVMEWHELPSGRRSEVTVDRKTWGRVPKAFREQQKKARVNGECNGDHPTPELVASGGTPEDEGSDDYFVKQEGHDEMNIDLSHAAIYDHIGDPPPAAVFSLRPDETIFSMPPTKASEETLAQLPLFAPPKPPLPGSRTEYIGGDSSKTTLIPVSKYAIGRMVFTDEDKPLRKRTRFEYDYNCELYADDSDEEGEVVSGGFNGTGYDSYGRPKSRDRASRPLPLHPEQNNVALFRPEFKPTLQRIRSHIFRPPLEQPPQAFFECRAPSLWTSEEDEKLRLLAKEYNHNWALVSLYMEIEGEYHSSAERRSPWECFERWMGIENVPQEFTKSPLCKPVQQRLELAARASGQHIAAANSSNGQQVSQLKRRGTVPAKVDRRRNTRPFSQFEAMRKLAKKRETSMSKQAQSNRGKCKFVCCCKCCTDRVPAAQVAVLRKQATPNPNNQMRTPQYFSSMKYEKDVKAMEQKQLMAQMSRLPQVF
jgi:chromatin modification-related protein VID21